MFCRCFIRSDEVSEIQKPSATLPSSILDAWASLPDDVRKALVTSEMASSRSGVTTPTGRSVSSMTSSNSSEVSASDDGKTKATDLEEFVEECPNTGTKMTMRPLERAPENVFEFTKKTTHEEVEVTKTPSATKTTKTTVVTTGRGWRNVFTLPISYDVNVVPHGTILDPANPQMLDATGVHPEGYNRRFAVIDDQVDRIYGDKIRSYFVAKGIELTTCILTGGEADKRPEVSFVL